MAKPNSIDLLSGETIPILYEDRSVLAIDKPPGWLLAPESWQQTSRNLQTALRAGLESGAFWAKSRGLKYLRFIHRLDAETSGVLLLAKSPGALRALSSLFETRQMEKTYLAVVQGRPKQKQWTCGLKLAPDPHHAGRMKVDPTHGKAAETAFRVLATGQTTALVEAHPLTGRTHQIRVHLTASGHPVVGEVLYRQTQAVFPRAPTSRVAPGESRSDEMQHKESGRPLALRAVGLAYADPFTGRRVQIRAPADEFLKQFEFAEWMLEKQTAEAKG